MPEHIALTEQEFPDASETDDSNQPTDMDASELTESDDDELTEEEEEALEEEHRRKLSRLARGCLEMAVFLLGLAGLFLVLELKANLSVLYILPPYTLTLGCVAGSFFAMMTGLFLLRKNAFAMMVMVLGGWMVLFVLAMIYLQNPETITKAIPGTEVSVQMTLVSTPISSSLYIEEPIRELFLARRWKFPIHARNIPLDELIVLEEAEDGTVTLAFEGQVWAVYDAETGSWTDVLRYEEAEDETEPSVEETRKPSKNH